MSTADQFFSAVKNVLLVTDEVKKLTASIHGLALDVKDHEHRITRMETFIEFVQAAQSRRLPDLLDE